MFNEMIFLEKLRFIHSLFNCINFEYKIIERVNSNETFITYNSDNDD